MVRKLPPVDVVLVGFGWTGAIMAQQLTDAGLEHLKNLKNLKNIKKNIKTNK
mgnify:CR=1 FL=1